MSTDTSKKKKTDFEKKNSNENEKFKKGIKDLNNILVEEAQNSHMEMARRTQAMKHHHR